MNLAKPPFSLPALAVSLIGMLRLALKAKNSKTKKQGAILVCLLLLLFIGACGQRGDLVLPQEDSDSNTVTPATN